MKQFIKEVVGVEYYRSQPHELLPLIIAKLLLRSKRCTSAGQLIEESLRCDSKPILNGMRVWRSVLNRMWSQIGAAGEGQGGIGHGDGEVLYGLVRALKPKLIIETGIAAGASTAHIGAALLDNGFGELYSVDLPLDRVPRRMSDGSQYRWQSRGHGWAIPEEIREALGNRHQIVLGDVREALPQLLEGRESVDMFFHDDLHEPEHMLWEYRLVWSHLSVGGVLISDDCNAGWVRFARERNMLQSGLRNLNNLALLQKV